MVRIVTSWMVNALTSSQMPAYFSFDPGPICQLFVTVCDTPDHNNRSRLHDVARLHTQRARLGKFEFQQGLRLLLNSVYQDVREHKQQL